MAFKCRECNETWPDKRNQDIDYFPGAAEPTPSQGTCPDCAEEEDEGDRGRQRLGTMGP